MLRCRLVDLYLYVIYPYLYKTLSPHISYPRRNLQGLEVSEVEWSWRRCQEVTGVATEEAVGRREGDT
jgi:hypothetical protein